jgi:hypothetical protein
MCGRFACYSPREAVARPVTRRVHDARNQRAELAEPVGTSDDRA